MLDLHLDRAQEVAAGPGALLVGEMLAAGVWVPLALLEQPASAIAATNVTSILKRGAQRAWLITRTKAAPDLPVIEFGETTARR